jgi:hypothetical protein
MTRDRIFGEDTAFSGWLRSQEQIPSSLVVATDCDYVIHRYKNCVDGVGTREIQALMILEVKTNNGEPRFAQLDTMWLHHRFLNSSNKRIRENGKTATHHGVSFLSLSGTTPANSETMRWGRFGQAKAINWKKVDEPTLTSLLRFDLHPESLSPNPYRRHHKTSVIEQLITFPLGFSSPVSIETRS